MTDATLRDLFRVSDTWTDQQLDAIIKVHRTLSNTETVRKCGHDASCMYFAENRAVQALKTGFDNEWKLWKRKSNTP